MMRLLVSYLPDLFDALVRGGPLAALDCIRILWAEANYKRPAHEIRNEQILAEMTDGELDIALKSGKGGFALMVAKVARRLGPE